MFANNNFPSLNSFASNILPYNHDDYTTKLLSNKIEYEMSEDYIETTSLTHVVLRVPHVGKQILEYLGDKNLMDFRILSHFWKNFVDKQRFTWIRIIKEISEFDRCTNRSPNYQYHANCKSFVHYFEDGIGNLDIGVCNNICQIHWFLW